MPADPEIAHLLENLNANAQLSIEEDGAEIEPNVQVLNFTEALEATDQGGQQVNVEVPGGGIDASKIGSGAVGTDELADNSVTSAKIPAGAIGSSEIATDAVDSDEIAADAVGESELDLSITPTWTGEHQFDAGIEIAEGQSIEDDGDVDRFTLNSVNTRVWDDAGQTAITLNSGSLYRYSARSGAPWELFDREGGYVAVQYTTDASTGLLDLINADLHAQNTAVIGGGGTTPSTADGVLHVDAGGTTTTIWEKSGGGEVRYEFHSGGTESGNFVWDSSEVMTLFNDLDDIVMDVNGDLFRVERGNVRMDTGQVIEDGGGNRRVELRTNDTLISGGTNGSGGTAHILFRDDVGGFTPFQYIASSSAPGEVRFSNAFLDMFGNRIQDPSLIDFADLAGDNNKWGLSPDGSGNLNLDYGGAFRFSFRQGGNLRLATGQSIEDGGGTDRFLINSNQTKLLNNSGSDAFDANSGDHHRIVAFSNTPITFFDAGGGFTAVQYLTSASAPGTLELTNAEIDTADNNIEGGSSTLFFDGGSTGSGALRWGDQGGGSDPRLWVSADGEVNASDDDGNTTQLT